MLLVSFTSWQMFLWPFFLAGEAIFPLNSDRTNLDSQIKQGSITFVYVILGVVFEFLCTDNVFSLYCLKYVLKFVLWIGLGCKLEDKEKQHRTYIINVEMLFENFP